MSNLKNRLRKAWFQGADEPSKEGEVTSNSPKTLGYPKEMSYAKKPMETTAPGGQDTRPWEQKWFEDAATETKKVMGPQGEEFKLKQKMQRIPMDEKIANAKLSVTFTRTASPKSSYWSIYATDKKTAKKELIMKATLEQLWGEGLNEENANMSATKEYGEEIIARLRNQGFAKVAYLMTGDTSFVKKADMMGAAPAAGPKMADEELAEVGAAVEGAAAEGAAREEAEAVELQEAKDKLHGAFEALLTTAPPQAQEVGAEVLAAEETVDNLIEESKEIAAHLRDKTLSASAKIAILKIADEKMAEIADEGGVLESVHGMADEIQKELQNVNQVVEKVDQVVEELGGQPAGEAPAAEGAPSDEVAVDVAPAEAEIAVVGSSKRELTVAEIKAFLKKRAAAEEQKYNVVPAGAPKDGKGEIDAAHPKGGTETGGLVVGLPVANKGGRVETVTEAQDHDLKVADKMPTGELNSTISVASMKGKKATASVDDATKKYYKDFYGQLGAEGKEFAEALTKDYENKVKAAVEETEGRVKRAFELAEVAATKGMCEPTTASKIELFNKISKFDDNAFVAFKEAVEAMPVKRVFASEEKTVKTASKLPIVGQREITTSESVEDFSALSRLGWSQ